MKKQIPSSQVAGHLVAEEPRYIVQSGTELSRYRVDRADPSETLTDDGVIDEVKGHFSLIKLPHTGHRKGEMIRISLVSLPHSRHIVFPVPIRNDP